MVGVELYGYSRCSSCRDAAAVFHECGVSVSRRDLFAGPLSAEEIRSLFARIGVAPRDMLASRSRPFRALNLGERVMTDVEVIELMSEHPALIRRPIVVAHERSYVGFNRGALLRFAATVKDGHNGHA